VCNRCVCTRVPFSCRWSPNGTLVNTWDAPAKGFVLNRAAVAAQQARGVSVFISLGGERAGKINASAPATFSDRLASGGDGSCTLLPG
jgi:hypothetical protein